MTNDRLHRIEELFHKARVLDPADRASFLDEECDAALDLRAEVESLLAHTDSGTSRMKLRPDDSVTKAVLVDRGPVSEGPGTRIGPYKILQQIGEGGFGVVYMAEQQEPVQRRVALKIIKLGMDTKQVIARFEAERQALAMMDHPNIARVLDAGATETGRPYFVMELVKGISVTEYCDKGKLSMRQRLDLFLDVCHAVQHAHQKGVIHRDIKPSNVLVTLHDTRPVPKVIDFGIAKATSHRLTEKTLFTEFRYFIGTPEYMSPDQAEISGLDVDTRTDIYSLGVLLYELLTGTTPFDSQTLRAGGYGEIQRIIREVEPPKPSTRLGTLEGKEGTDIALFRRAEPGSLSRLMRGDLDWVVMKALEKDRTRRYQSASELAGDIERYLENQPVIAGPPSVGYKFRKFVQRHRLGVTAVALIAVALVTGLGLATAGFVQARREAQRSQQIADFLQSLFVSTSPDQAISADADVERVLVTAREVFGNDHATVAATLSSRALQLQSEGDLEGAEALYRESMRLWSEQFGADDIHVANTLGRLGILLVTKGDDEAAEEALRESVRIALAQPGADNLAVSETLAVLGGFLVNQSKFDEAAAFLRESIRIRKQLAPHQRFQIALTINSLVNVVAMAGMDAEADELMPELLESWRRAVPADSTFLARVLIDIAAQWHFGRGEYDTAEPLLVEALNIFRNSGSPVNRPQVMAVRVLFKISMSRGDPAAALPIAREQVELAREWEHGARLDDALKELGNTAWQIAREPQQPEQDYRAALDAIELVLAEKPDGAAYINTKGILHYRLGDDEAALETLARSHAHYSQQYQGGVPADLAFMAMAHHRLGHAKEARQAMTQLRGAMSNPDLGQSEDNRKHMEEAEALLGVIDPEDPGRD